MVQTISIKKTVEVVEIIDQEFPLYFKDEFSDGTIIESIAFLSNEKVLHIMSINDFKCISSKKTTYEKFLLAPDFNRNKVISKLEFEDIFNEAYHFIKAEFLQPVELAY